VRGRLLLRRLLRTIFVLWGASTVVFVILRLSGDPIALMLPPDAGPEVRELLRRQLGFDQPIPSQYALFLRQAAVGDFGVSIFHHRPAMEVVLERIPATFQLTILAIAVTLLLAIPIGIFGALRANTVSGEMAMGFVLIGQSTPVFFLGLLLVLVLSSRFHLLPSGGTGELKHLIMPVLTLSVFTVASIARLTRSSMLDVMGLDYIRTARAKGLREVMIISRHALKNAALPIVTVIGLQFGALLGGAVVTETIFSWPGMGRLVIQGIESRDYPVVQAAVLVAAMWFIIVNTLVDVLYLYLDPRIQEI
jgi:peptide/nickel transport system permease protein